MKFTWALILVALLSTACSTDSYVLRAQDAAEAFGLYDVTVKSCSALAPSWLGCSDKDDVACRVVGTNHRMKRVEAVVCMGFVFKGATVRIK